MPKISIIVPVYGAEKYLHRCLDSILAQTFTDWECILVDDGSKDSSGAICDEYATRAPRFHVYHKENGGVSSARNRGIEEAKGGWCCFIDSDDWVEPSYLQNFLVEDYSQYGCILQSFYRDFENDKQTHKYSLIEGVITAASELEYFLEYTEGVRRSGL